MFYMCTCAFLPSQYLVLLRNELSMTDCNVVLFYYFSQLGFFKRQYEKMTQDIEDVDEIAELTKGKD